MLQLRTATRQQAKLRLGLSATSGAGKTYSALLMAKGLTGGDLSKVALIDTENGSGDLYAHLGPYNVLPLSAPYNPERYVEAIKACEAAGMEVIIIDSITHEWDGPGGILSISSGMTGNSYTNWAKLTPRHDAFLQAILQSSAHIITTVRRKQDYEMSKDSNGKATVTKLGLKEVTRDGWEYEVTVNLELETNHHAAASKDRTGLFTGKPSFIPSEETGKLLKAWCESGVAPLPVAIPVVVLEELTATHPDYPKVLGAASQGYTIATIEKRFKLSDDVRGIIEAIIKANAAKPASAPAAQPKPNPVTQQHIQEINSNYQPAATAVNPASNGAAKPAARPF